MTRQLDNQTTGQPDNWMTGLLDHGMIRGLDEQKTGRSIVVVHKCSIHDQLHVIVTFPSKALLLDLPEHTTSRAGLGP